MINKLIDFLHARADLSKPILLGVSGGPDSLLLLYLMNECRQFLPIRLGVAHIDHRWRLESEEEASKIRSLAQKMDIPFHLRVLSPEKFKGNLEAYCRRERIAFFAELCKEHGYQAVALGHHADDLVETVLKRFFEGASLFNLGGMQEVLSIQGLSIWRPFLQFTKKQILGHIKNVPHTPFEDRTNLDPRFLRGRFRTEIIPALSQSFGKDISKPLRKLSAESNELKGYFLQRLSPVLNDIEVGKLGVYLDLNNRLPDHPLESKFIIKRFCEKIGFCLSETAVQQAVKIIYENKADKFFEAEGGILHIDRRRLFGTLQKLAIERWHATTKPVKYEGQKNISGWRNVWNGCVEVILPLGEYELKAPVLTKPYPRSSFLSKLWTDVKAPAFLRRCTPVLWKKDETAYEFLSGRTFHKIDKGQDAVCITLNIC